MSDGDLRILGARDGFLHVVSDIRLRIGHINYRPIDRRHVRKLAERERILAPLRELEEKFLKQMHDCLAAWEKSRVDTGLITGPIKEGN